MRRPDCEPRRSPSSRSSRHCWRTSGAKSLRAFESIGCASVAPPKEVSRSEPPSGTSGGAVPAGSPFYVVRECDRVLARAVARTEGTVLVHGPRQVGKTSLLGHVLN